MIVTLRSSHEYRDACRSLSYTIEDDEPSICVSTCIERFCESVHKTIYLWMFTSESTLLGLHRLNAKQLHHVFLRETFCGCRVHLDENVCWRFLRPNDDPLCRATSLKSQARGSQHIVLILSLVSSPCTRYFMSLLHLHLFPRLSTKLPVDSSTRCP